MCDEITCGIQNDDRPLPYVSDESRRLFLKGLAALPLATVLAYPDLAHAAGQELEEVNLVTPGGYQASGVVATPDSMGPAPTLLLIHEWWGLNDQIKAVAVEYAKQGYIALAIDLYGGKVGTNREEANALRKAVKTSVAMEQVATMINWLKKHNGSNGKVGTVGWCFGGGWSLNASLAAPVDATVVYYGSVKKSAAQLAPLQSPVLGHFATKDKWINKDMVDGFEKAMKAAGKAAPMVHWYEADHAFANPTGSRYDAEDAALAWQRTMDFFTEHLKA